MPVAARHHPRQDAAMPALTRRRDPDALQETWRVYYDDVQVGTISRRAGVPVDVDQWGWSCGFFPAIDRSLRAGGTTATFVKVRADFAAAWARYLPRCTDADYNAGATGHAIACRICAGAEFLV